MENQDIPFEASKRKFDIQEEKSLGYLGRTLMVDRETMTVFLPYNIMENLNRRQSRVSTTSSRTGAIQFN